ncbi:unnamed protein product [Camellia sinensis]
MVLLTSWVIRKIKSEDSKQSTRKTRISYYKQTLLCCLGLSLFNMVLCLLNCFYWYQNGWSDEKIVTLLDLALRTLAWLAISVYLHTHFSNSGEPKFPISLRVWWGFYFSMSCYFLVLDLFFNNKHQFLPTQFLVSDFISAVTGLFFCYVGVLGKKEGEDTPLQEPLLNGNTSLSNGTELNKSGGSETVVAPCSNATIFSTLTFSWMDPLIAFGYKKALDLEDVPQLDRVDSVKQAFPIFRNKLESDDGNGSGITILKLATALIFTTWRDILFSALLALVYTLLVESFVWRHCLLMLQKAGIRAKAVLVAKIYNKGLTISCQSKQGHTSGIGDFG